ncbi:PorH family porin [Corynebacterium diphtheriae bv. gravis]|nr:PorH family porin [Corynebacterium diphtheriae]UWE80709.1 PorH family porin [Corynebacterium diphtheriae bv. gravis]UWE86983.1 PorH family porin [Corynebacterium diphtheriae bv. gravis]UWF06049.1 PorH family porin [Corynebacterium diphtheriae bv. gravis]UWF08270.1 PorH family porin [Corynebacterium diphtheriae bv. gravis]
MLLRHVLKLIQYLLVTPTVASDNHSIRWCIPAHLKEKNMDPQFIASQLKNFETFVTNIATLFEGFPQLIKQLAGLFNNGAEGWGKAWESTKKIFEN